MSRDLRESTKKQRDQRVKSGVDLHEVKKDSYNKGDKKEVIQKKKSTLLHQYFQPQIQNMF